jgi:hypothetical protein
MHSQLTEKETTAMTKTFTQQRLVTIAQTMQASGLNAIEKFQANFATNPGYALEWADGLYAGTAQKEVGDQLMLMLDHWLETQPCSEEELSQRIVGEAQRQVQRAMLDPARSTSPSHNLMHQSRGQAWAFFLDRLNWL